MPSAATLATFAVASAALIAIPGPAVMYIVSRSIHQGRKAGVVSALGVDAGILLHVVAAVAGLSALLAASAVAFTTIKLFGAAYLIVLGVRTLLDRSHSGDDNSVRNGSLWRTFRRGVIVNALNPKVALFFLAFLPQFVDPSKAQTPQLLAFGVTFFVIALISDTAYASIAGTAAGWLGSSPRVERGRGTISGTVTVGLGVTAALTGNRPD